MKSIAGTWRLVRGQAVATDGTEMPAPYGGEKGMGSVTFHTDGRMMAVLCDGRATLPAGAVREYNSYCGTYTFDGKTLVTKVFASSDPPRLGADQVRDVTFEGPYMVLRPPVRAAGDKSIQRILTWERIADA